MRISDWSSDVCSSDRGDLAGAGVRRGDRRERLSRHRRTGALGSRAAAAGYCAASATGGALAETSTVLAAPGSRIEWVRSEEHTSELQSLMRISYAVFCLKKKKK